MSPLLLTARARAVACAVAMASLWSTSVSSAQPETQLRSFHLGAPRVQVFPLFTALGERAWAPGWDPVLLAGAEERGSAFRTKVTGLGSPSGNGASLPMTRCSIGTTEAA